MIFRCTCNYLRILSFITKTSISCLRVSACNTLPNVRRSKAFVKLAKYIPFAATRGIVILGFQFRWLTSIIAWPSTVVSFLWSFKSNRFARGVRRLLYFCSKSWNKLRNSEFVFEMSQIKLNGLFQHLCFLCSFFFSVLFLHTMHFRPNCFAVPIDDFLWQPMSHFQLSQSDVMGAYDVARYDCFRFSLKTPWISYVLVFWNVFVDFAFSAFFILYFVWSLTESWYFEINNVSVIIICLRNHMFVTIEMCVVVTLDTLFGFLWTSSYMSIGTRFSARTHSYPWTHFWSPLYMTLYRIFGSLPFIYARF